MFKFVYTPFPRPKKNFKNVFNIFLLGFIASLFIIFFKPFAIVDNGIWYVKLIILAMGVIFSLSIYTMEFLVPNIFKRLFQKWTLGKAILWYTWMIFFVSGVMFLVKSFLAEFNDFTLLEYVNVIGRVSGIGLVVSFFTLGIVSYFNRQKIALLSSKETYQITAPRVKSIELNLDEVMYIMSDDNYVDIHIKSNNEREKIVFRSSLKNIENQIVNPISPIYRCHRQYLINTNFFKIKNSKRRNMSIELKEFEDEIPVSNKYTNTVLSLLQSRP
ncbi:LytTR family transcriptional regulator DNA-binding domain-containing protein [uncultured Aquimarina sp.]|uniref:LytTR family transcriptional regulator DNA-binding domain-containing protein n=1 Tax=uncultured Aquimarina sp. TaxID=575652 RepID=UPI00263226C5|nr:LytTR family transcriptional regulator DNA-binding domain-containing protein [uncultured Aquimarina sp.]